MKSIQVPQALNDLYRDMRDRRLLIPAIALIVGALAIPFLLKSDPPAPAPPLAPAADADEPTAAEAAVLVEQTGIRDYRKRLAELKERNPFEPTFETPRGDAESSATGGGGSSVTVTTGGGESTTEVTVPDPSGSDGPSTIVDDLPAPEIDVPSPPPADDPNPDVRFFADRADVSVGPLGHGKTLEGVRPLELLPDDNAPVLVFVGLAPRGQGAVFNLSPDVIETSGEGSCAPHKPNPCQFLTLKPGEEQFLKYGLKGTKTYRVKLIDAYVVRVPDPR